MLVHGGTPVGSSGTSGNLPRTEWPSGTTTPGLHHLPPPFALLRQEQVLFKDAPETATEEEDKGQVAGCVVEVWGGLTHVPSLSVCLSACLSVLSVCPRR